MTAAEFYSEINETDDPYGKLKGYCICGYKRKEITYAS